MVSNPTILASIVYFATFARDDYGNQLKISSPPPKVESKISSPPLNLAQKMVRPPHHVPRACQVTSAASLRDGSLKENVYKMMEPYYDN